MDATAVLLGTGICSGWALAGYFVRLFFKGDVIPRRTHEEIVNGYVLQLAERDRRNLATEALAKTATDQNKVLLDSAIPTVNRVLLALGQAAEGDPA